MATGKALNGKPYAVNPHVRFDEWEVASAATSRRGSLLYRLSNRIITCCLLATMAFFVSGYSRVSSRTMSKTNANTTRNDGHKKVQLWKDGPYWAETNIGAEKPWESGYYFWWGDTVGYKRVNDAWVASDGSSSGFAFETKNTPTCKKTLRSGGWITTGDILTPKHDAAHVPWGGRWRMPTLRELIELEFKCDWTWTVTNDVNGYVIRGKGNYASASIFLPAAGYGYGTLLGYVGSRGCYWPSIPHPDNSITEALFFDSKSHDGTILRERSDGVPIRPVQGSSNSR